MCSNSWKINIGAWMTDNSKVTFASGVKNLDIDSYMPHALWDLTEINVGRIYNSNRYSFLNELYNTSYVNEDLSFGVVLKRKPLYFMMNNIFPSLILNCITLFAFALPFPVQIGLSKESNWMPQICLFFKG